MKRWTAVRGVGGCAAFAIAMLALSARQAAATPPEPPGSLVVRPAARDGKLEKGRGRIAWEFRVRSAQPIPRLGLEVFVEPVKEGLPTPPARGRKPVHQKSWEKAPPDQTTSKAEIEINGPGVYEVDVRLKGEIEEGNGFSDRALWYVVVGQDGAYRVLTAADYSAEKEKERRGRFEQGLKETPEDPPVRLLSDASVAVPEEIARSTRPSEVPANRQLQLRPARLSDEMRRYSRDRSGAVDLPSDPIVVKGRLTYLDFDGAWKPLINVSVYVWDEDTFSDDFLGLAVTDWNGFWSVTVDSDDGLFGGGQDIYYVFGLENTRIRVQPSGSTRAYSWHSVVHNDIGDGSVLDFGNRTGSTNAGAMQVWGQLNLAWNHATAFGGQDPGFVACEFPSGTTGWNRSAELLKMAADQTDAPDTLFHEYGHAVMFYAYGKTNPSPGGSHSFGDMTQDTRLSWSEGWATGFMLSARPDGVYNWHEGDTGRNIERFKSKNRVGEANEGRVAAAIFDLLDTGNDDNGGDEDRGRNSFSDDNARATVSIATMLRDTLWGNENNDFLQYWYLLAGNLSSAQRPAGQRIMYYNWMSVFPPDACASTRIAAREFGDADSILAGVRRFRDDGLRKTAAGRELIAAYYRNSPELALILLKSAEARGHAAAILKHYAAVGNGIDGRDGKTSLRQPVLPKEMRAAADAVLAILEKQGSDRLKADLVRVRETLAEVERLTYVELIQAGEAAEANHPGKARRIEPAQLNPASAEALRSRTLREGLTPPEVAPPPARR